MNSTVIKVKYFTNTSQTCVQLLINSFVVFIDNSPAIFCCGNDNFTKLINKSSSKCIFKKRDEVMQIQGQSYGAETDCFSLLIINFRSST